MKEQQQVPPGIDEIKQEIRDAENYDKGYWDGFKAGIGMRWKYFFKSALGVILFPLYFPMMLPIEYPLWRQYKKDKYNVPNYLTFFWDRCVILTEQSYTNGMF